MNILNDYLTAYYDGDVINRNAEKYNMEPLDAARQFLASQAHEMLEDAECEMRMFSPRAIFDMGKLKRLPATRATQALSRGNRRAG